MTGNYSWRQGLWKLSHAVNPYGDGKASLRIAKILQYYFKKTHMYPEEFDVVAEDSE